jgi:hypothetical protein
VLDLTINKVLIDLIPDEISQLHNLKDLTLYNPANVGPLAQIIYQMEMMEESVPWMKGNNALTKFRSNSSLKTLRISNCYVSSLQGIGAFDKIGESGVGQCGVVYP